MIPQRDERDSHERTWGVDLQITCYVLHSSRRTRGQR